MKLQQPLAQRLLAVMDQKDHWAYPALTKPGLSREQRVSAATLAQLLRSAWSSAVMPELAASLPIFGVDGTLKSRRPSEWS